MTTTTTITRICNICGLEISKEHDRVDAGAYGADFHKVCADQIAYTVAEILGWLELDDVTQYSTMPGAVAKRYKGKNEPLNSQRKRAPIL